MNRSVPKTMTFKEWLLLILLSVIWGGSFFFNKIALTELPTFTVVLGRIGLGGILLLIFVYATGHAMPRDLKTWRTFAVMGLMNNFLPFSLIVWGQTHIASGLASILNSTTPFFTVILAHLLTQDERITPNKILGVLLGLVGVSVMIGLGALKGLGNNIAGQVAVLGAALCYAMSGIYGRRLKKLPPITAAAGQVVSGAILLLPLALYVDRPWNLHVPGLTTFGAVLGLAFFKHRCGVHYLFPFAGHGRPYQCAAGHPAGPGYRRNPGNRHPGRTACPHPFSGNGPYRLGPRRRGRPLVQARSLEKNRGRIRRIIRHLASGRREGLI
jgi:drug/metabolite transporter (DMT)-like permease